MDKSTEDTGMARESGLMRGDKVSIEGDDRHGIVAGFTDALNMPLVLLYGTGRPQIMNAKHLTKIGKDS